MNRSTASSTINGKAYEFAVVLAFLDRVSAVRPVKVVESSSLAIARSRYEDDLSASERAEMLLSARVGANSILQMEPRILSDGNDTIELVIQADSLAKKGDIRDVLVLRRDAEWEIGVSVKHNHEALKHSRLSSKIDFAQLWLNLPASKSYFHAIRPIFAELETLKAEGVKWRSLVRKKERFYLPVLEAFVAEVKLLVNIHGSSVTRGLIQYLLGSSGFDYYKLIHYNQHLTRVIPFNLFGTLNQAAGTRTAEKKIPPIELPTTIVDISLKPNSQTTIVLTMDRGWAISFRLHSASTTVEPSLKFDIQLVGQPANLFFVEAAW